jgi:hypothetical protein
MIHIKGKLEGIDELTAKLKAMPEVIEKPTTVSTLTPAAYNPRKITDKQLSMLAKSMKEFGDLSGIVRNVKTGNLIGGHQRVKNLDPSWLIISKPHTDKAGTVALGYIDTPSGRWQYREVSWPEKKEAAANIAANKQGGEFDMPKLKEIILTLDDCSFDTELIGFNSHELELMMTAVGILDLTGGDGENKQTTYDKLADKKGGVLFNFGDIQQSIPFEVYESFYAKINMGNVKESLIEELSK